MKKLLFLLLFPLWMSAQVSTGQEFEADYGIKNNAAQTVTSAINLVTQGADGTYGKITFDNLTNRKAFLSTGLIKNGLITINADPTKYNISAGIGIISNFDDPENPISTLVNFSAITGHTPAYLNTGNITYIAINSSGAIVESASQFTTTQRRDLIILGAVIHSNLTSINVVNNIAAPSNAIGNQLHDFMEAIGALNLTGNKYTAAGANLQLNKSAGTIFKFGVNFATDWKNPHELSQGSGTSLTFRYRTQNGTEGSDRINLDPSLYDLSNVLTAVPNNKFTIQTVTVFQTGLTRIQYGQNVYDDLASAQAAVFTRDFVVENNILMNGITRAYIIVKNNATSLQSATDAKIIEAQKFGGVASGGVALTFANIVTALGYTPENAANKATDFTTVNNTLYPTVQAVKTYADGLVVGLLDDRGTYNASSNVFPSTGGSGTAGAILKGDIWYVGTAGTLGGKAVAIGDSFRAISDSPGQTSGNWALLSSNLSYVPANDANVLHKTGAESKSGILTLDDQLKITDGILSVPSILFFEDPASDTGINHINDGEIDFITNGVVSNTIKATGITSLGANLTGETASTIASFDASKNIKSLSTATYPSLTELSYVKSATSAIQTQLNNRPTGTGTTNYLPIWTGSTTLSNSAVQDNGTDVVNTSNSISGSFRVNSNYNGGFQIWNSNSGADVRNWAIVSDNMVFGDFAILRSNSLGGNPVSAGSPLLYFNVNGSARIPNLSGTGTRTVVADASGNLSATDTAPTSGSYTPTLTNTLNVTGATLDKAMYTRIGDIVTVTIAFNASVTTGGSAAQITISLPINRTVSTTYDSGSAAGRASSGANKYISTFQMQANTTEVRYYFEPISSGSNVFIGTFTYSIN